jgi:hypothetical protein
VHTPFPLAMPVPKIALAEALEYSPMLPWLSAIRNPATPSGSDAVSTGSRSAVDTCFTATHTNSPRPLRAASDCGPAASRPY